MALEVVVLSLALESVYPPLRLVPAKKKSIVGRVWVRVMGRRPRRRQ